MTNEEGFSRDDMQIRVVGICGSLREESHTRTAVRIALDGAGRLGADTSLIDLRDYELPLCDGREDENTYSDGVHRLRREVGTASGLILGTPEYHGGLSGVLKNAMDLMGFDEFQGKMVGLVGVSGGGAGSLQCPGYPANHWPGPARLGDTGAGFGCGSLEAVRCGGQAQGLWSREAVDGGRRTGGPLHVPCFTPIRLESS